MALNKESERVPSDHHTANAIARQGIQGND